MARPLGKKPKLTRERINDIVRAVAGGAYFKDACRHAGIREGTGYEWIADAESPEPLRENFAREVDYQAQVERHALKRDFADAVSKAEADAKIAALARIQRAGRAGVWTADAWYLERKYPHEFGRRVHELSGPEGGPIVVADEARDRIATLLERLSPPDQEAVAGNGGTIPD